MNREEILNLIEDFQRAKPLLRFEMKEGETNLPHVQWFNLSAVPVVEVDDAIVHMTKDTIHYWGVSDVDVIDACRINSLKEEYMILNIGNTLKNLVDTSKLKEKEKELIEEATQSEIYVCTNKKMYLGLSYIIHPHFIEDVKKYTGLDEFVVLPSTRHEAIIVPNKACIQDLIKMHKDIQHSKNVDPRDRVTDTIYIYKDGEYHPCAIRIGGK